MAHFNSSGSDISNDLKRAPFKGAILNLHWYKELTIKIKKYLFLFYVAKKMHK
jgi:hypothetical protein